MTNHRQIAELFAQGAEKATGSRMFIREGIVYSYGTHFPIAKRMGGVFLFNSVGYSSSTAKHKSYVKSALNGESVIELQDCNLDLIPKQIEINNRRISEFKDKEGRARKHKDMYRDFQQQLTEQNLLLFNLGIKENIILKV